MSPISQVQKEQKCDKPTKHIAQNASLLHHHGRSHHLFYTR